MCVWWRGGVGREREMGVKRGAKEGRKDWSEDKERVWFGRKDNRR